jgi:hypothetical protein
MGICYKTREIDYENTLRSLRIGEYVTIPTKVSAIENVRANVSKASKKLPNETVFCVKKDASGAVVKRIA